MPKNYCTRLNVLTLLMIIVVATPANALQKAKPGRGQKCDVISIKLPWPSPTANPDKSMARGTMFADLIELIGGRDVGTGYAVMHVDETTGQRRFEAIDLRLEPGLADSISARIAEIVGRESVIVQFPVKVRGSPWDSLTAPYEQCPPALRNQPTISRLIGEAGRRLQATMPRFLDLRLETHLWVFVTERGRAIATVVRRSSGEAVYDRAVRELALRMEFHPLLLNRTAHPVWVDIPVRLVLPADTAGRGFR